MGDLGYVAQEGEEAIQFQGQQYQELFAYCTTEYAACTPTPSGNIPGAIDQAILH